jgi:hypothetical protein
MQLRNFKSGLKWILEVVRHAGVGWIQLALCGVELRALLLTVVSLRILLLQKIDNS